MSPGVSNSYAIGSDAGRVVINAGLPFEGRIRRQAYDAVCAGPTRALIFTQGHADHFAGYRALLDEGADGKGTDIVMQENWRQWKLEHELLPSCRARNAAFAWSHMMDAMIAGMSSLPQEEWQISFPEPTRDFADRLELNVGGREIVLIATPGGETTDALIVWVPDERTVFTGNLFGPLFGHVPNLVTIRGDRYRDALHYVASANTVLALGAERLVTGHFDPIEGAATIREEVTQLRDSTQWLHDRVIAGMEAGDDVFTLMQSIRLPEHFDVGEAYGKTAWNVRAIWETYSGWFKHQSITELFGVPVASVAADIVSAAGTDAMIQVAQSRYAKGDYLEAIHLIDIVLKADSSHAKARELGAQAHEKLLQISNNFWEQAWLKKTIQQLRSSE